MILHSDGIIIRSDYVSVYIMLLFKPDLFTNSEFFGNDADLLV